MSHHHGHSHGTGANRGKLWLALGLILGFMAAEVVAGLLFADLKASVMRLMELPPETLVHPGHREPTTIGAEWEGNPFVRIWRGLEEVGEEECTVWGRPATLKLWAPDYDGGHKAWIVFGDDGTEAIVGGSQVERA